MEIRHKLVSELTDTEYKACLAANFGWEGYMREELKLCRDGYPGKAILLWHGPEDTIRSLRGWALLTPTKAHGLMAVTQYGTTVSKYSAQFWVKRQWRRRGYGTILMEEVKKYDPRPHVLPHDDASSELFSSFNVYVMANDKHWLKKKPKRDTIKV
jgi:GNAT superfamily N-acetyltransferase